MKECQQLRTRLEAAEKRADSLSKEQTQVQLKQDVKRFHQLRHKVAIMIHEKQTIAAANKRLEAERIRLSVWCLACLRIKK